MDFWPESPASGVEKWISGFFLAKHPLTKYRSTYNTVLIIQVKGGIEIGI
jgi:hypothetical protein